MGTGHPSCPCRPPAWAAGMGARQDCAGVRSVAVTVGLGIAAPGDDVPPPLLPTATV